MNVVEAALRQVAHEDLMDLRGLLAVASPEDLDRAREAVELITRRGFDRDRDLAGALTAVVAEAARG